LAPCFSLLTSILPWLCPLRGQNTIRKNAFDHSLRGAECKLQQAGVTLKGIYPGQPGRQTAQPTTEMMLGALRGVTLSRIKSDGKLIDHLTPLHAVQKRILSLMEVPLESYDGLVT
jgi:hypothetical protein